MIVATAGHIDHGKTALVQALTGTDADRLPEEKRRGITIDLGFAYLPLPGGATIGFVDVPGHERLVRTMLAGASGVDLALLVVAADDGVMPQTLEHLAVLDLLGVRRGIIALTKIDRVEPARLAQVEAGIRRVLAGMGLAGAPVMPCSSLTGEGVAEIAGRLRDGAFALRARDSAGRFRLAVDRGFTLPGIGLVVTGTVHAGRVSAGDRLVLSPSGIEARVRGLHAQNAAAMSGTVGQRVALNIAGARVGKEAVRRGDWLVAPELHLPTTRLDVRLRLLRSEARALRHCTGVHLHLGTASVTARVMLLEAGALPPGGEVAAQLALDAPIGALWGDRFVIRDASARRTVGGGVVLDPFPPRRGRKPERAAILAALGHRDHAAALDALLRAEPAGLDLDAFRLARNLGEAEAAALFAACTIVEASPRRRLGFTADRWGEVKASLLDALGSHHARYPDSWGATADELANALPAPLRSVTPSAIRALLEAGMARRTGQLLHFPDRELSLPARDAALWKEIEAVLASAGLDPPRASALAERLGLTEEEIRPLLDKLARVGWLRRASRAYYITQAVADRLAGEARRVANTSPAGLLTVGRFREATGISRHATMPILEYLDRTGLTVRVQEGRAIRER